MSNAFPIENTDLTISCKVTHFGFPKSTIAWLRNNNYAEKTDIALSKIQRSENGVRYTCRVKNVAKQIDKSTVLNVAYRGTITRVSANNSLPIETQSVTLTCHISNYGNPRSTVSWFKNDLKAAAMNEKTPTLKFTSVSRRDAGSYFCKISNSAGDVTSSTRLDVACK